jgi:hypothetical protein
MASLKAVFGGYIPLGLLVALLYGRLSPCPAAHKS